MGKGLGEIKMVTLREAIAREEVNMKMRQSIETKERTVVEEDDTVATYITAKTAARTERVLEDLGLSYEENHLLAAKKLLDLLGWPYKHIAGGSNAEQDGFNFVLIEEERV
tara:strand:- start:100 stop:432 length:333 start_codon:yes stop_codon:yes gene_type:complete